MITIWLTLTTAEVPDSMQPEMPMSFEVSTLVLFSTSKHAICLDCCPSTPVAHYIAEQFMTMQSRSRMSYEPSKRFPPTTDHDISWPPLAFLFTGDLFLFSESMTLQTAMTFATFSCSLKFSLWKRGTPPECAANEKVHVLEEWKAAYCEKCMHCIVFNMLHEYSTGKYGKCSHF